MEEESITVEDFSEAIQELCTTALKAGIDITSVMIVLLDSVTLMACEIGDKWETVSSFLRISYERISENYKEAEIFGRAKPPCEHPTIVFDGEEPS